MKSNQDRPSLWIGHVAMAVPDPASAHDYYVALGMRSVFSGPELAITELRGGTHLILLAGESQPGEAPFDLMVDDLGETHAEYRAAGLDVSDIVTGEVHAVFILTDPDGKRINVSNSHVVGSV